MPGRKIAFVDIDILFVDDQNVVDTFIKEKAIMGNQDKAVMPFKIAGENTAALTV